MHVCARANVWQEMCVLTCVYVREIVSEEGGDSQVRLPLSGVDAQPQGEAGLEGPGHGACDLRPRPSPWAPLPALPRPSPPRPVRTWFT